MIKSLFSLLVFTILFHTANSQVDIEIYDADVFYSKIDPKVYNVNAYPKNESMQFG